MLIDGNLIDNTIELKIKMSKLRDELKEMLNSKLEKCQICRTLYDDVGDLQNVNTKHHLDISDKIPRHRHNRLHHIR